MINREKRIKDDVEYFVGDKVTINYMGTITTGEIIRFTKNSAVIEGELSNSIFYPHGYGFFKKKGTKYKTYKSLENRSPNMVKI